MSTTVTDCPFLDAAVLGLSDKQRDALIMTLLLMEADQVYHAYQNSMPQDGKLPFHMSVWRTHAGCGTVCCLGGTAEEVGALPVQSLIATSLSLYGQHKPDLHSLFFSWGGGNPTPAQAAKALRGYLTTGLTNWKEAMS